MPFRPVSRELGFFAGNDAGSPAGRADSHAATRAARKPRWAGLEADEPEWLLHQGGGRRIDRDEDPDARCSGAGSGEARRTRGV